MPPQIRAKAEFLTSGAGAALGLESSWTRRATISSRHWPDAASWRARRASRETSQSSARLEVLRRWGTFARTTAKRASCRPG